ncbi:DedA family protein [Paracoccaceae bacterium GXU_MW_L88]
MFDLILNVLERLGLFGVFLLMLAENIVPPIPSELVIPLAGFLAARGAFSFVLMVIAGAIGATLGALIWYEIGRGLGEARLTRFIARYGHWLTLSQEDVGRVTRWFRRHGALAVLFGRMVPGLRTFISIPAGLAGMPRGLFLLCTFTGSLTWTALLGAGGFILKSQYARIEHWLNPVTNVVLLVLVAVYVWRSVRR